MFLSLSAGNILRERIFAGRFLILLVIFFAILSLTFRQLSDFPDISDNEYNQPAFFYAGTEFLNIDEQLSVGNL